jgi:hypothetical protein
LSTRSAIEALALLPGVCRLPGRRVRGVTCHAAHADPHRLHTSPCP